MMKNRHRTQRNKDQARPRARRRSARVEWEEAGGISAFQHILGNRGVERLLQNGKRPDSRTVSGALLPALRRAFDVQAARLAAAPAIQRQEVEALDAAPAAVNDGQVTINPPQVVTYEVRGSTLAEVAAQLDPEEWGRCRWQVDYSFETTNGRATKVDITLNLTIRLPQWAGPGYQRASEAARREWQRMLAALRAHEDRHAEIARNWAPVFKERMLNQRQSRLARTYQQVLREMEKEQKKYDKDTTHGQSEGVTLDLTIQ